MPPLALNVPALLTPALITKSSLFGIGIAFSTLHIAVVTLLLLGRSTLQRAMAYVAGWAAANALAIVVLMVLGEAFSISLTHGSTNRCSSTCWGPVRWWAWASTSSPPRPTSARRAWPCGS